MPPGFRSGKIWKMVVAVIGYLMVADVSLSMEITIKNVVITGIRALLQRVLFLLSQLTEIAIVFDYMGCQDRIIFLRTRKRLLRIVVYIVLECLLVVIAAALCVLLDGIIWGW